MGEARGRRGVRWLRAVAAGAVLLALAGYLVVQYTTTDGPPRCVVQGPDDREPYELEPEMARNAATIEAVAAARGLPERAVTIALATAMQESALRNIGHGDRDSVGLFQQRPSQGWGTVEEIMDPVYAAGKFYDHLVEVPGYTRLPLTVAAQRVQRSGFPQAYAKHEPQAGQLTAALTGRAAASLHCTGATARAGDADRVREKLVREFGAEVLPPGDVTAGRAAAPAGPGAAAPDALVIPVPAGRPQAGAGAEGATRRGWELAHWSVVNASELGIARVTYGDRTWDAQDAAAGWTDADGPGSPDVRLTLAR
ncbi:hypothetical protein V1J52_05910 [Streptomyces sp. TRM 70351]|uniref:hypothetical protein n=1 Tax=Streptomyces sp. TRM 70351 TaxID=3116552 RepID=UPI002E7BF0FE|nr:hypothetical protein [Streptomyces sp. TRM 70351]MEE1927730.1 hypothetical protein [Streptomyces sp. TRM 70351]